MNNHIPFNGIRNPADDRGGLEAEAADDGTCFVCGKEVRETWFARLYEARGKLYLCSTTCALSYFDSANPPAHDHQAQHEFQRVRAAIVQVACGADKSGRLGDASTRTDLAGGSC